MINLRHNYRSYCRRQKYWKSRVNKSSIYLMMTLTCGVILLCVHRGRQIPCGRHHPDEALQEDPVLHTLSMLKQSNFSSRLPLSALPCSLPPHAPAVSFSPARWRWTGKEAREQLYERLAPRRTVSSVPLNRRVTVHLAGKTCQFSLPPSQN